MRVSAREQEQQDRDAGDIEPEAGADHLYQVAFITDDAVAMRAFLAAKGVKVPDRVPKGRTKNSNYMITDPDGHLVEIVQYEPDGFSIREKGKFMPDTRISTHMTHFGVLIGPLEPAMKFYRGIFGMEETWRGGGSPPCATSFPTPKPALAGPTPLPC